MTQPVLKQKASYYSVNKKAFDIGDKIYFSLFINGVDKKKIEFSKASHTISEDDKEKIDQNEKIFIKFDDADIYKEYVKAKKQAKKSEKISQETASTDSKPKVTYYSVNKKVFKIDDKLDFSLYVNQKNKKVEFSKAAHYLDKNDINEIQKIDKIFIKSGDVQNYKNYVVIKREAVEKRKKSNDINFLIAELKSVLTDIFSGVNTPEYIKKTYPLVENLSKIIIRKKLKLNDLRQFISRDYHTATHSINVALYASTIGRELQLSHTDMKDLILSGLLHDIGKTQVSEKILNKTTALDKYDHKEIKKHGTFGFYLAKEAGISNKNILSGIHHHHERLDGSGYPNGFKDKHISLFARIIGLCDVFDAISTNREFQDSKTAFEALIEIKSTMKEQLDKELIANFIKVVTA